MKPDNYRSLRHLCSRPIRWFSTLLAAGLLATPPSLFEFIGLAPIPLAEIGLYADPLRMGWSESI